MENSNRMLFLRKMILLALVLLFLLPPATSHAQTAYTNSEYDAMSYMLVEMDSGKVLAEHDAERKVYPASTTKLMTALLLMEQKGLSGEVTIGTEINGLPNGSSLMHIEVGEKVTVKNLMYGLMLCSGNDAACTIGTYVSGSVDAFVALMNQRAAELGMTGTHFNTPYGGFINQDETNSIPTQLLGEYNYTTAADMAKLALAASKYPEILEAGNTYTYTLPETNKQDEREIINSNPLIHTPASHPEWEQFHYQYANGLKTGTVNNIVLGQTMIPTYGNVVATASKDGLSLIALIFDDESEKEMEDTTLKSYQRWFLAADLFNYGFDNYAWLDISQYIQPVTLTRPVATENGAAQEGIFEIASRNDTVPGKMLVDPAAVKGLADGTVKVEQTVTVDDAIAPSVPIGAAVGTVEYTLNGTSLYKADLLVTGRQQAQKQSGGTQEESTGQNGGAAPPAWLLWVVIPAAAVGALFLMRGINLSRRRRRRSIKYRTRH